MSNTMRRWWPLSNSTMSIDAMDAAFAALIAERDRFAHANRVQAEELGTLRAQLAEALQEQERLCLAFEATTRTVRQDKAWVETQLAEAQADLSLARRTNDKYALEGHEQRAQLVEAREDADTYRQERDDIVGNYERVRAQLAAAERERNEMREAIELAATTLMGYEASDQGDAYDKAQRILDAALERT